VLEFALQIVDIVFVVRRLLPHLRFILFDHLVVATLSSFLLFVEALLQALLLRFIEGFQFLNLLLGLIVNLLQRQLVIVLFLVDFLFELTDLILVAMVGVLDHSGALGLLTL